LELDPWGAGEVKNYDHVFKKFGLNPIPASISKSLKFRLFERGIVIAHRDFDKVYARIKAKKPFINMTGIASSGPLHFGHKVDLDLFIFFKKCGAKNYFSVSDIDAYVSRPDKKIPSLETAKKWGIENLAHALALGLNEKDVFVQSQKESRYYEFTFELSKKITKKTFEAIYGHLDLGKVSANLLQYADIMHPQLPEYEGPMPSVTGIGLEQDPHARATRDIAKRLPYGIVTPGFIYFQHQSGLKLGTKMSASHPETAIFLDDAPEAAAKKVSRAFTGGRPTVEEQRKLGGRPEICKVHELLKFHYPNTKRWEKLVKDCKDGKWLCGECKQFTGKFVSDFLKDHQKKVKTKLKIAEKIVLGK